MLSCFMVWGTHFLSEKAVKIFWGVGWDSYTSSHLCKEKGGRILITSSLEHFPNTCTSFLSTSCPPTMGTLVYKVSDDQRLSLCFYTLNAKKHKWHNKYFHSLSLTLCFFFPRTFFFPGIFERTLDVRTFAECWRWTNESDFIPVELMKILLEEQKHIQIVHLVEKNIDKVLHWLGLIRTGGKCTIDPEDPNRRGK